MKVQSTDKVILIDTPAGKRIEIIETDEAFIVNLYHCDSLDQSDTVYVESRKGERLARGFTVTRFDIVEGHYAFCCDYYNGQGDKLYARLCRIRKHLKLSPMWRGRSSLSDEGRHVYDQLVKKHFSK